MKVTLIKKSGYVYLKGKLPEYVTSFIKNKIKPAHRAFDSENYMYGIKEDYFINIKNSLLKDFTEIIESDEPISNLGNSYQELYLIPAAPIEVVKAAYKALSLLHHPDLSNDSASLEKMIKINDAYQRIIDSK